MEPITRSEQYLASIIGEDVVLPVPQSRIEHYLNLIAQNGISPSSAGLISYDPDADYPDGSLGAGMKAEAAEVNDLKSHLDELEYNATFFSTGSGQTKYFRYDIKQGHRYRFTTAGTSSVAIGTADSDGGEKKETISSGLYPPPSNNVTVVDYLATADRDYLRIYFNATGSVTVLELTAEVTQLLTTSPYHLLKYKYDAKALGGSTDDDVAIQNYINDETFVYIPAGTYYLKNPLSITKSGVVIQGESYGFRTVLRPYDNTVTSLINAGPTNPNSYSLMLNLRNICFRMVNNDGTHNPNPAITSDTIIIDSKIENCWFNGGSTSAALVGKAMSFQGVHTMILGCWFEVFDTAVEIINTQSYGYSNGFVFNDCTFWNNTNTMLLSGTGTVRGCTFAAMKGGFAIKTAAKSNVVFSDNALYLSAPSDLDTDIYTTAAGKVIEVNHKDAALYIRDVDVFDSNDGNSFYQFLLNAPAGKVSGRYINSATCKHLAVKNSVNADVYFAENPLADVCAEISVEDDRIILDGLLPDCSMAITSEAANSVMVANRNAANVPDITKAAAGYLTQGTNNFNPIVLSPGNYTFKVDCSGYTNGKSMWVRLYDASENSVYYSNVVSITDNVSFDFTLESAAAKLKIYADSPGVYTNVLITPTELKAKAYEPYHGEIISIGAGETLRVLQNVGENAIYAYTGDVTVNAVQTPLAYIASLETP